MRRRADATKLSVNSALGAARDVLQRVTDRVPHRNVERRLHLPQRQVQQILHRKQIGHLPNVRLAILGVDPKRTIVRATGCAQNWY